MSKSDTDAFLKTSDDMRKKIAANLMKLRRQSGRRDGMQQTIDFALYQEIREHFFGIMHELGARDLLFKSYVNKSKDDATRMKNSFGRFK